MEAKYKAYSYLDSISRVDEILNGSDASYENRKTIPKRDSLTYKNGYYVYCSVLFIDMRDSKSINEKHKRPVLAKIYKTYISELVAVLKGHSKVSEISIEGDCVWGVFNTPENSDIDELFSVAAKCSSLIDILNIKYKRKGYSEIEVGMGLSYGEALLIKSGYKGSTNNEVVWLGKLVSETSKLCSKANKDGNFEIMLSNSFQSKLNKINRGLTIINRDNYCYETLIVDIAMDMWVKENG